jgi:5'-nucleotidase
LSPTQAPQRPDWQRIHTVLLDMDGTLLDLHFDNYFWGELVPLRFGEARGLSLLEAQAELKPMFAAVHGTLPWYCTDHWSRQLGMNIAALKHEARDRIQFLPGAEEFLQLVRQRVQQVILVTNAHLDAFAVKTQYTDLAKYLDRVVSSHSLGFPKESAEFWPKLEQHLSLVREQALFVDDNLAVLRAAKAYGIGQIFAIAKPDTKQPVRHMAEFPAVNAIRELLE